MTHTKTIQIGSTELEVEFELQDRDETCSPPIEEEIDIIFVHAQILGTYEDDVVELDVLIWEPIEDKIKEELMK